MTYSIALHGGAGAIKQSSMDKQSERAYLQAMENAIQPGEVILSGNGTALDAAEAVVKALEDEPLFNAGRGAVLNKAGTIENEANIMCGKTANAGAATAIKQVQNPIALARKIMEESPHVLLYGEGAEAFARECNLSWKHTSWFYTEKRISQWSNTAKAAQPSLDHDNASDFEGGTVGCVARDELGNLAAATSTGGMNRKWRGRIGDSAQTGLGTFADNETCAVSCTGEGDYFIRTVAAYDLHARIKYQNLSLEEAASLTLEKVKATGGSGGLIAVDKQGNIVMPFNSDGMFRMARYADGSTTVKIYR